MAKWSGKEIIPHFSQREMGFFILSSIKWGKCVLEYIGVATFKRKQKEPGLETWQKILLKCGTNAESRFQYWRSLVKKVNAKKVEQGLIICKILKIFDDR